MKFNSKIGWWFHITVVLFTIITLWLFYLYIINKIGSLAFILFISLLILFILPRYFLTYYVFEDSYLYIRSGLILNIKINYGDIISFKESNNIISSPALSMDRLEIKYYKNSFCDSILISPDKKQEFIDVLSKRIASQI
ncbi:PH domain-containing protein [Clostridium sp. WLY-B-L2]|uniref:PH domain-containing protein n=1 Tax=Clostridium aromativorans TaxID=2836848 RepID=A0ABS8NA95_9CLOT|nr:PH domain-containing protein [Clostridium aromativorans]MCC9296738.1 PH domain-containing protein [Clostridium aromativorans]